MTTTEAPRITALAPWFGGKRNMADLINEEVGDHKVWWEPFCGSLAVTLAKPPCLMETVNDLHGDLINLARCLKGRETAEDLYSRVARFVFHEGLYEEAAGRWRDRKGQPAGETPDVGRAEDYLVASWFGRSGVAGTASNNAGFCVRYTANGGHAATRWRSACESIPAWHERLRNVTILNRDAFDLLARIDDQRGTAIYVDSPYIVKGCRYLHDFTPEDHERLAAALARFRESRVVVSYYAHPDLARLYPGWNMREIEVTKSLVSQGMRGREGATKATEVLLVNGPLRGGRGADLFSMAGED